MPSCEPRTSDVRLTHGGIPSHTMGSTSVTGATGGAGHTGLRRTGRSLPLGAHTQVGRKREMMPRKHVLTVISDGGEWYPGEKTGRHARKGLRGGGFCRQGGQKGLLRR